MGGSDGLNCLGMWGIRELLDSIHELIKTTMKCSATRLTSRIGEAIEGALHHACDLRVAGRDEGVIARWILAASAEAQRGQHTNGHLRGERDVGRRDAYREPEREAHRDGENAHAKSSCERQPGCEGAAIGE